MANEMEIELKDLIAGLLDHSYAHYGNTVDTSHGVGMFQEAARAFLENQKVCEDAVRKTKALMAEMDPPIFCPTGLHWPSAESLRVSIPATGTDQPTDIPVLSQAHALDIIVRHLPDDGFSGASRRWNPIARAIVGDLVAAGCHLRVSANESVYAGDESLRKDEAPAMDALADGLSPSSAPIMEVPPSDPAGKRNGLSASATDQPIPHPQGSGILFDLHGIAWHCKNVAADAKAVMLYCDEIMQRIESYPVTSVDDQPVEQPEECRRAFEEWSEACGDQSWVDAVKRYGMPMAAMWMAWKAAWKPEREIVAECKTGISVVKPEHAARGWAESTTEIEGDKS